VVWVTRLSDSKRIAIDPNPDYDQGTLGRVNPARVNGKQDVVEMVPEEERWMRERLYTLHYATCREQQRCKRLGVYGFSECLQSIQKAREIAEERRTMSQTGREELEPSSYSLRRDQ
jgi:hypothetical protein